MKNWDQVPNYLNIFHMFACLCDHALNWTLVFEFASLSLCLFKKKYYL